MIYTLSWSWQWTQTKVYGACRVVRPKRYLAQRSGIYPNNHCRGLQPATRGNALSIKQNPVLANRKALILLHDNVRPHFKRMTLMNITDLTLSTILCWSLAYWPTICQPSWQFWSQKTFGCKENGEASFKDFLLSKPFEFYYK